MIKKLNTCVLEGELNFANCCGVRSDQSIERFHAPYGSNRHAGSDGKLNLFPSDKGARGAELTSSAKAHALNVANLFLHLVTLLLIIITNFGIMLVGESRYHNKEVAMAAKAETKSVAISAPKFGRAEFGIRGTEVLVIHRFSAKTKNEMKLKMETGKAASSKKTREPKDTDQTYMEARYIAKDGWDGFHAGALRNALISACRLVGFKMTLAKLSIFVEADGYDKAEPQIPLIRIYGDPVKQEDMARVETGQPYVTVRAAYHDWKAKVRIRWDQDQFTLADVSNLLARVGMQVGIGEGRPDSKNSAGMGWGLFEIEGARES